MKDDQTFTITADQARELVSPCPSADDHVDIACKAISRAAGCGQRSVTVTFGGWGDRQMRNDNNYHKAYKQMIKLGFSVQPNDSDPTNRLSGGTNVVTRFSW